MFNTDTKIERSNSRYVMLSCGRGRVANPLYSIVETATGETVHMGTRKHIVEMWNTRYNYSRSRSFATN